MKTKILVILAIIACVSLVACGKRDDEVNAVMKDLNAFTSGVVAKIQTAQTPAVGLAEAQKYLDAQRADIKKKIDSIKSVREFQISADTEKKMEDGMIKDATDIASLQIKYASLTIQDNRFRMNLEKLINDYKEILGG